MKLGAGEAEENLKLKLSLFFSIFGQLMSSLVECQSWNELCDMYLLNVYRIFLFFKILHFYIVLNLNILEALSVCNPLAVS